MLAFGRAIDLLALMQVCPGEALASLRMTEWVRKALPCRRQEGTENILYMLEFQNNNHIHEEPERGGTAVNVHRSRAHVVRTRCPYIAQPDDKLQGASPSATSQQNLAITSSGYCIRTGTHD